MTLTTTTHRKRRLIPLAVASFTVAGALAAIGGAGGEADALPVAVALGPSGADAPTGNLPGWRQIFRDDFTTNVPRGSFPAAVSDKWGAYPSPWRDTSGHGVYSPKDVVSIADGVLIFGATLIAR